jgi:hypothetical protein
MVSLAQAAEISPLSGHRLFTPCVVGDALGLIELWEELSAIDAT